MRRKKKYRKRVFKCYRFDQAMEFAEKVNSVVIPDDFERNSYRFKVVYNKEQDFR